MIHIRAIVSQPTQYHHQPELIETLLRKMSLTVHGVWYHYSPFIKTSRIVGQPWLNHITTDAACVFNPILLLYVFVTHQMICTGPGWDVGQWMCRQGSRLTHYTLASRFKVRSCCCRRIHVQGQIFCYVKIWIGLMGQCSVWIFCLYCCCCNRLSPCPLCASGKDTC